VLIVHLLHNVYGVLLLSYVTQLCYIDEQHAKRAIASVHSVHMTNAHLACQVATSPQTKTTILVCESTYWLLPSTPTILLHFVTRFNHHIRYIHQLHIVFYVVKFLLVMYSFMY